MDRALVTGGAGFLGSHVAEHLLARGMRVVVLDDLSGGFRRNVPDGAEFHQCSITDVDAIEALFARHRFTYVYHLAAYAAEALSHFVRRHIYAVDLVGSINLINAAIRYECSAFVFTSSIAVYGSAAHAGRENDMPAPEDPYGVAKFAVEQDLRAAERLFGLPVIIFRPHNVYGERQNLSDPYRNVVGIFMNQVKCGVPCTVFGDGIQTRAFSYIDDVAPVIAASVHHAAAFGQVFNIGADQPCTVVELAELVQQAMGRRVGIRHLEPRQEALHPRCDHDRVRRTFGLGPPVPLADGLARMAAWARPLQPAAPRRNVPIEIERNLPPAWARALEPSERPVHRRAEDAGLSIEEEASRPQVRRREQEACASLQSG